MPGSLNSRDNGRKTFYATYTAYSGRAIRSELLETTDFRSFRMTPLSGTATRNKGMGLFPRKINGRYAMIGRQDNENLYLIYSDDLYTWDGGQCVPAAGVSLGVRSDRQLRLTHRAGRRLAVVDAWRRAGAEIFDRSGSAGQERSRQGSCPAREPLVRPEPTEREGYVPNVVYTCGACAMASGSFCRTRFRTPSPILRP